MNQQEAIYNSNQKAPLGSSHNQSPGLPSGLNPLSTSFGLKTIRTESAGDMVNPQKTASEVEHEYIAGRDLYKKVKAIIISYLGCSVCVISTFRNCIIYSSQSLLALTIIVPTIYLPCNNSDWQGKVPKLAGRETYVSNLSFTSLNLLSYPSLTQYSALFRMSIIMIDSHNTRTSMRCIVPDLILFCRDIGHLKTSENTFQILNS